MFNIPSKDIQKDDAELYQHLKFDNSYQAILPEGFVFEDIKEFDGDLAKVFD